MTTTETVTATLVDAHGVAWKARDLSGRTDRPLEMGGKNEGLMASEHVLVALVSCTATTARKVADKRGVALDAVEIVAHLDFDERGEAARIRLRIVAASAAPRERVVKVFDLAERACTISKMLAIEVEREVVTSGARA